MDANTEDPAGVDFKTAESMTLGGLDAQRAPIGTLTERLAAACRILADEGHASGLAGQITAKAEEGGVWTLPIGTGFDEAVPESFIRVGADLGGDALAVLEGAGRGIPNPAVRFHLWVYRARPDAGCLIHTHPPAGSALSMIGRPLAVAHMDSAMLYEDCAYLAEWPGVPIADDEGRIISAALGPANNVLLAHHGILNLGDSVEMATYRAYFMERACRRQLDAEAAGDIVPVDPANAREARDFLLQPAIVNTTFRYLARRLGLVAAGG